MMPLMRALFLIASLLCSTAVAAQDLPQSGTEPPPVEGVATDEEVGTEEDTVEAVEEVPETAAVEATGETADTAETEDEPSDAPEPPSPVFHSGFSSRFPGSPYRDRRTVRSIDLGFGISGHSPVGWAGSGTLYYLNLGAAFTNHIFHLEAHTMFVPLLVDTLLGIGMINANLAQSDDFPPFVRTFNASAGQGIYELANARAGFHFGASERTSWSYDFHTHALFFGAPIGELPEFYIGVGGAVTRTWIDPLWDLSVSGYVGPELGSDLAYFAGVDVVWRRALAKGFGTYVRWNAAGHYLTIAQRLRSSGVLEAGFSFSNWK
jgi:hypothetical protein